MNTGCEKDMDMSRAQGPKRPISLNDFLNQFERMVSEKNDLASRLSQALHEKAALDQLHEKTRLDFDSERRRLNSEIDTLRSQLSSRFESVIGAKERLIREEFERKYQDLLVEVRRERSKHGQQVNDLRKQLSNCICHRSSQIDVVESVCGPIDSKLRRPIRGVLR